jgi:hypothetical protein
VFSIPRASRTASSAVRSTVRSVRSNSVLKIPALREVLRVVER